MPIVAAPAARITIAERKTIKITIRLWLPMRRLNRARRSSKEYFSAEMASRFEEEKDVGNRVPQAWATESNFRFCDSFPYEGIP